MVKRKKEMKKDINKIMVVVNSLCETFVGLVILWLSLGPFNNESEELINLAKTNLWGILLFLLPILLFIIFMINWSLYLIKKK